MLSHANLHMNAAQAEARVNVEGDAALWRPFVKTRAVMVTDD